MRINLIAVLFVFLLSVFSSHVLRGDDFIHKISHYEMNPQWPVVYPDANSLARAMADYDSPEAFMAELRDAMRACPETNPVLHRAAWEFARYQCRRLPFTEKDYQYFIACSKMEKVYYERNTSIECLAAAKREEILPVLRQWLDSEHTREVISALKKLGEYGDALPEPDIDRVIQRLSDLREDAYLEKCDGRIYNDGDWFIAYYAMKAVQNIGPRAARAYDAIIENLVDKTYFSDIYDETKFAAFLEKIGDPELTPDGFWKLMDDAGLRPTRKFSDHENFIYTITYQQTQGKEAGKDANEKPMGYSPETEASVAKALAGGTKYETYDAEKISGHTPREKIHCWFNTNPAVGGALLKIDPNDRRGQFLLMQTMLVKYEITNTGEPLKRVDNLWCLNDSRVFLPIIDLLLRHPEMIAKEENNERFLRMPGDPPVEDDKSGMTDEERINAARLGGLLDVLFIALEGDLTEAECLRYAKQYLDLPQNAEMYSLDDPVCALVEHQQKHRVALDALMKSRMAAAPEDSAAYCRAEVYLEEAEAASQP